MTLSITLRHDFGPNSFALDVAFQGPAPGVTALFGPSGCGKSTILAAAAGLLRPKHARITLDGTPLTDTAAHIHVPPEQRRCGVVFQDARLFPHLTNAANLRYGARRNPRGDGPGFEEIVDLLGLAHLLARRPAGLSGGECQRVALGRALLSAPRLLLMDEPLAALDAPRRAEVLPFLERIRDRFRLPILYVTHALDEVDRLADELVVMAAGRVIAAGPLAELAARTDIPALADRRDAGVVLACTITDHDEARGLTRLSFAGGALTLPLRSEPIGTRLRLRVRARDVSIAVGEMPPAGLSIQSVLPAHIAGLEPHGAHEVFVRLAAGETILLARITRDAAAGLALRPGQRVFALVKAIAFAQTAV